MNKSQGVEVIGVENPAVLSDNIIREIQLASQDIWSKEASLGELCQCPDCFTIYSAEDIFSTDDLKNNTVSELLMQRYGGDSIPCKKPNCSGMTELLFGAKYANDVRSRYSDAVRSFLVLCREKDSGRVVGFEDGYIGPLRNAVTKEFQHYNPDLPFQENRSMKWVEQIEQDVARIVGYKPDNILTLSTIGVMEKYQGPMLFFEILKRFTELLPNQGEDYFAVPGITEIDKRNVLYRMCEGGGGKALSIEGNPLRRNVKYQGGLFASPKLVETYKGFCVQGPRGFIRLLRT